MSAKKIYLGKLEGEELWISKHKWDCGWYWGFGSIGNSKFQTYFNTNFLTKGIILRNEFEELNFSEESWWKILDLFYQAHAIREAARVYRYGAHLSVDETVKVIVDKDMETRLNKDLEKVLDFVWNLMLEEKLK